MLLHVDKNAFVVVFCRFRRAEKARPWRMRKWEG